MGQGLGLSLMYLFFFQCDRYLYPSSSALGLGAKFPGIASYWGGVHLRDGCQPIVRAPEYFSLPVNLHLAMQMLIDTFKCLLIVLTTRLLLCQLWSAAVSGWWSACVYCSSTLTDLFGSSRLEMASNLKRSTNNGMPAMLDCD